MNNIRPIWTPQDSIDTAQAFAMELHNAERGVAHISTGAEVPRPIATKLGGRLFSVSRERKARYLDALAVALLMILMAAFGCVVVMLSPSAKADPDSMVYAYAAVFGEAVCSTLDSYPSYGGIYGIADAITDDGLTFYQAGQVIAVSVMEICPRHTALVKAFAASATGGYA